MWFALVVLHKHMQRAMEVIADRYAPGPMVDSQNIAMADIMSRHTFAVSEPANLMQVLCLMVRRLIDNEQPMEMLVYAVECLMLIPAKMKTDILAIDVVVRAVAVVLYYLNDVYDDCVSDCDDFAVSAT